MDNERELLAAVLYEDGADFPHWCLLADHLREPWLKVADSVLAAGWRKVNDIPKRGWPVTTEAVKAYLSTEGGPEKALRAAAPFLWRSRVRGMTEEELGKVAYDLAGSPCPSNKDLRAALLALGDL